LNLEACSQIVISSDYESIIASLRKVAAKDAGFEFFIKDGESFKVEDANEVIAKAYLASNNTIFLVLYSDNFSDVVQNRLLKIIEEPPKNKEFVLITPSKASLLPTIKSRLPVTNLATKKEELELDLNFNNLDLNSVYNFIQKHKRLKPKEAIVYLEEIITKAIKSNSFNLDSAAFDTFKDARVALDVGSPADFVLTTVLLKLLAKKDKKAKV
jgi:DNA polymerase-3 subunit delta'